jgi:transmembrane sensor
VLAWRRGEIVFDGDTVAAAAEEFNRYNARKIVLGDPAIGQRTIVGYFLIDQPEKFALAASRMIGGATHEDKDRIVIETSQ